ncbi:hypothetical protein LIZ87_21055, partial [Lacrimispora sp. 210928-DFI.3.58]|nr:hypothetical protein [Lacrimispora sp. 210928-DFI.3.58]
QPLGWHYFVRRTGYLPYTKGKRKLKYEGVNYYWYIKKDSDHIPCIHVVSEDKSLQLTFGFDREIGIETQYVKRFLKTYL